MSKQRTLLCKHQEYRKELMGLLRQGLIEDLDPQLLLDTEKRTILSKFSAQNYLKMRETGKYTQRTLNKVIESLADKTRELFARARGADMRYFRMLSESGERMEDYLKMRETGMYTQRRLNKVIVSLPPLYLDLSNCRQEIGGLAIKGSAN